MTATMVTAITQKLALNRQDVALLVAEHSELLAAARASVAAAAQGEHDPLVHVRHALASHGQLPVAGAAPQALLARAAAPTLAACLCTSGCTCGEEAL